MKRRIAAWKILALEEDQYGNRSEVQAMLTLGTGTFSRMRTLNFCWAKAGKTCFVASSAATRTN